MNTLLRVLLVISLLTLVAANSCRANNRDVKDAWQKYIKTSLAGKIEETLLAAENAAAVGRFELGMDHPATLMAYEWVIQGYESVGNLEKANAFVDDLAQANVRRLPSTGPKMLCALRVMSSTLYDMGEYQECMGVLHRLTKMGRQCSTSDKRKLARDYGRLARVQLKLNRPSAAMRSLKKALKTAKLAYGNLNNKQCRSILKNMAYLYETSGKLKKAAKVRRFIARNA